MLYRRVLRKLIQNALIDANIIAGDYIFSPGDWPTVIEKMPAIRVLANHEEKVSVVKAQPNFNTTTYVQVDARIVADNEIDAQDRIDCLCDQIYQAVLTYTPLMVLLQQVSKVSTEITIDSKSQSHFGDAKIIFHLEFFESQEEFDATKDAIPITSLAFNLDAGNIYDPNGSYPGSPFAANIAPPPRKSGPDGRNEGYIVIDPSTLP